MRKPVPNPTSKSLAERSEQKKCCADELHSTFPEPLATIPAWNRKGYRRENTNLVIL